MDEPSSADEVHVEGVREADPSLPAALQRARAELASFASSVVARCKYCRQALKMLPQ